MTRVLTILSVVIVAAIPASLRRITTGARAATIGLLLGGRPATSSIVSSAPGLFRRGLSSTTSVCSSAIVADIAIVVAAGLAVILFRSPHPEDKEPTAYRSDDD